MPKYVFGGIEPFIDQAADDAGLAGTLYKNHARSGWHAKSVGIALSQLPEQLERVARGEAHEGTHVEVLDRLALIRASLAAQLAGVDAAIKDVVDGMELGDVKKPRKRTR